MTRMSSIPPLRDLPPGRLEAHRAHLLAEIGRRPWWRFSRPAISWTSLRVAAVAGASATAAAAITAAVAMTWGGGSVPRQSTSSPVVAEPALVYHFHATPPRRVKNYVPSDLTSDATAATGPETLTAYALYRGIRVPILVYVLALRQAAENGDRQPTGLRWVKTSRQLGVSSQSGDRVDHPRRPVYFVVLHGHFVDKNAYYLGPAADAPRGTVLSFTVDRKSGQILDFALGNRNPDYAKLGRMHPFRFVQARGTK